VYLSLQVLVTACPCALVLATPATVVCALARAAQHGVLIKSGAALEALRRVCACLHARVCVCVCVCVCTCEFAHACVYECVHVMCVCMCRTGTHVRAGAGWAAAAVVGRARFMGAALRIESQ
jgi:hypothetical protein